MGRGSPKRDHIGQRVHLLAKSALGVGHSRHTAIQTVQHHSTKHTYRRQIEAVVHGHDDGVKTPEQSRQGE
jgi:hypothetical protein